MTINANIGPAAAHHILLVDDEPSLLAAVSRFLTVSGFHVQCASSGADALSRFAKGAWDVVVTDLMMPGMKGDELARHLRAIDPAIPIILATGFVKPDCDSAVFDKVLSKPFDADTLLRAIEEVTHASASSQP